MLSSLQGCPEEAGDAQGRFGDAQGTCTFFSQVTPLLVPLPGRDFVPWWAPSPAGVGGHAGGC